MDFRILGPLEVRSNGGTVPLGGRKQRALLALLLLHANRVVSRDELLDALWPEQTTSGTDHALRIQISRLRKALATRADEDGDGRLSTRPPGYMLRVECDELDADRFEQLTNHGRAARAAGDPGRAAAMLRDADALWRGRPLADMEFDSFVRGEADRLDELRLSAAEDRIEIEIELGRQGALVPELEALIAAHPLRERLRALLMRALYASGRQAEALTVYSDTRRLLVEELGIQPGEELRELERKVLTQDPQLRAQAPHGAALATQGLDPPPAPRRWRRATIAAVALVISAVAIASALVETGSTPAHDPAARAKSLAVLNARSGKLVAQVPMPPDQTNVKAGAGAFWTLGDSGVLVQVDARTLRVLRSVPLGLTGGDIAVGEGAAWVSGKSPTLARIDPRYGTVTRFGLPRRGLTRPDAGGGVAVGAGSVWVAQGQARLLRISPVTGRIERTFSIPNASVVAYGDGAVWVASSDLGRLTKIDPRTNTIAATTRIGAWICCLTVGGGYAWAANDSGLWKVADSGDPVARIPLANEAGNVAYTRGGAWVTVGDTVLRVDAQTDAVRRVRVGHVVTGIGADGDLVAASVLPDPREAVADLGRNVLRGVFVAIWFDVTDPAVSATVGVKNWATEQQLQRVICAPLMRFAGARLVPEVAAAPPVLSHDRRSYTFRIRPGFRFSPPANGPVTAAVFKYSIERALSPGFGSSAPGPSVVADIAGTKTYRAGLARHISGIEAHGNSLVIRLVRPSPDFPDRISASYFCPVPLGTPVVDGGLPTPIPSAGPYYLSANFGGLVAVLKRNPNYGGRQPRRLAAIVFRQEAPLGSTVARIESGRDDYAAEQGAALAPRSPPARRLSQPADRRAPRYFTTPLLGTDELAFNTRSGVFANAHLRRAVNLALDRSVLAAALGDLATDRYLPPGMPGYIQAHVYPLDGRRIAAARALVANTTRTTRLAVCDDPSCLEVGRTVRAELGRIGIDVQVRRYGGSIAATTSRAGADIVLARVLAPYPEPVTFLRLAFGGGAARSRLEAVARLNRRARLVAANRLDLAALRGEAPAAVFGTPAIPEFFSGRVGCETFPRTSFGVELGALCLHG